MVASWLHLLVLSVSTFRSKTQSTYECHNDYSCALTTISDTATSGSNIECMLQSHITNTTYIYLWSCETITINFWIGYGYNACSQCPKIESTGAANIYCRGSYSCYQATLIQHTSETYSDHVYCMLYSIIYYSTLK